MQYSNFFYDYLDINECISFYGLFINHAFKYTACPGENETLLLTQSILLGKYVLVTLIRIYCKLSRQKGIQISDSFNLHTVDLNLG